MLSDPATVRTCDEASRRGLTGEWVRLMAGVGALPEDARTAVLVAVRTFDRLNADAELQRARRRRNTHPTQPPLP